VGANGVVVKKQEQSRVPGVVSTLVVD